MRLAPHEIENRVNYHPPNEERRRLHEAVRSNIRNLMYFISEELPDSRETSLALTKLEEVMFWANAAIARNVE